MKADRDHKVFFRHLIAFLRKIPKPMSAFLINDKEHLELYAKHLLLSSVKEKKSYRLGTTWEWCIFAWTITLNIQESKVNGVWPMCLLQDAVPFFVNATAGTTVQGAFDPLNRIADISERNGMWMHVDVSATRPPYATSLCNTSICLYFKIQL